MEPKAPGSHFVYLVDRHSKVCCLKSACQKTVKQGIMVNALQMTSGHISAVAGGDHIREFDT
jgi:hypothetical protein